MTLPAMSCAGAILAGGQSTRMGFPKEGVVLADGRKMIEPIIDTLLQVCKPVIIVGACRGFSIPPASGILHLLDTEPGQGPLAAIRTLLRSGLHPEGYLICACDQPFLTVALIRLLIVPDADRPRILEYETLPAPFPGYYPVRWKETLENAYGNGERAICDLLQSCTVSRVAFPAEWKPYLRNMNTPEDL